MFAKKGKEKGSETENVQKETIYFFFVRSQFM